MQTSKEYLLFSILSYYNFSEKNKNESALEALKEINFGKKNSNVDSIFKGDEYGRCSEFFNKELKKWKIYEIDNRTSSGNGNNSNSGFFAVIFTDGEEYVISYRGSETYPFEEAYKDFIETDLRIGMGKKPLQFWEGVEVFENLLKAGISLNKITITGHSLGGGIAQFVAIMIYKKYNYIPNVCTWNAVGINRDGIIGIEDFIDFEKVMTDCGLTDEEKEIVREFKSSYLEFFMKQLKKYKVIKDNRTALVDKYSTFYFQVNNEFVEELAKQTNFKQVFTKIPLKRRRELLIDKKIIDHFFQIDNIVEIIYEAVKFIKILNENKIFENNVINFCHSKDLVSCLFPHIGTTYQIDLDFLKKDLGTNSSFFRNLSIFKKSVQSYHFEDVFIPFLNEKGIFINLVSDNYVSSVLRKVIYLEYPFTKKFLGEFFSGNKISEDNFLKMKNNILTGIEKIGEDILYKDKVKSRIQFMEYEEINDLWERTIKKYPSPYISQDIYDLIVFRKHYI